MDTPAVKVTAHLPERRKRPVTTLHAGCCCCCCCCLHTAGSVIGAFVAPIAPRGRLPLPRDPNLATPDARKIGVRTLFVYWSAVCVQIFLYAAYVIANSPSDTRSLEEGSIFLAVFFPGIQFLASVVAYVVVRLLWLGREQDFAVSLVGRVVAGSFLGGAIGMAIMAILLVALLAFK
ncbi:MAG TPA: hypothetical protein VFE62_20730 [Gemmataceae bacterium]|nr:hypothetical protein [Gemmataceae bacterium]